MLERTNVVVVGAGPVGLLTAIELALRGVSVLVFERLTAPSTVTKALGVGPLGIEALQRRGMGDAIADAEAWNLAEMERFRSRSGWGRASGRFSGHFAFLFIPMEPQREPERRMRAVDQQGLEAMLGERARALGVALRRGCEVERFAQDRDGVDVFWASSRGGGRVRCSFLVGCDGGRSAIRKMAGFAFPGTPPTMTMFSAAADIDDPAGSLPGGWRRMAGGVVGLGPFPRRLSLLDFSGPPADRDAPVTREEVEAALRRITGADVRLASLDEPRRWTDNTRLVDTYRLDRVLLAGDAAHVHSPFGGQGLSLGLSDAANLGWKLAAVVRGAMPDSLLDSYTAERRPAAEAVLANTLAQAALLRPDPQSGAMRDVMARLIEVDEVSRVVGEAMRGIAVRYDVGIGSDDAGRLVGDRPVERDGGAGTLYDLMQDGAGVFLDGSAGARASERVRGTAAGLRCVPVAAGRSTLIRPDACVAWQGDGEDDDGLREALHRWFVPAHAAGRGGLEPEHRSVAV